MQICIVLDCNWDVIRNFRLVFRRKKIFLSQSNTAPAHFHANGIRRVKTAVKYIYSKHNLLYIHIIPSYQHCNINNHRPVEHIHNCISYFLLLLFLFRRNGLWHLCMQIIFSSIHRPPLAHSLAFFRENKNKCREITT